MNVVGDYLEDVLAFVCSRKPVYIHCWGGRGRAGTMAALAFCTIFPELGPDVALARVQKGYDARVGADNCDSARAGSPETRAQSEFVRVFSLEVSRAALQE